MVSHTQLVLWITFIKELLELLKPHCVSIFELPIPISILLKTVVSEMDIVISVVEFINIR
jgi:hypothetical protein